MTNTFLLSNGLFKRTFVQNGILYYSPNCTRPAIIPPQTDHTPSPFNAPRLSASLFRQLMWWSSLWGWVGFIPMTPPFISVPFEPFCWMPVIEKHAIYGLYLPQTGYRMRQADIDAWNAKEDLVVRSADLDQIEIWNIRYVTFYTFSHILALFNYPP